MCGIAGYVLKNTPDRDPGLLYDMARCIEHRGPDDEGYYKASSRSGDHVVGLALRRLSILVCRDELVWRSRNSVTGMADRYGDHLDYIVFSQHWHASLLMVVAGWAVASTRAVRSLSPGVIVTSVFVCIGGGANLVGDILSTIPARSGAYFTQDAFDL